MELGDRVRQEHPAHLSVRRMAGSLISIRRATDSNDATRRPLRVTQVDQSADDLAEPFGRTTSLPLKRSLAALTNSSSSSRSLMRC